jgi:hypothetical protein
MKINVEVDISPAEARAFLGLPDVAPMQAEVLEEMKRKALESMNDFDPANFDPAKSMENYFSLYPKWMEAFSKIGEKS